MKSFRIISASLGSIIWSVKCIRGEYSTIKTSTIKEETLDNEVFANKDVTVKSKVKFVRFTNNKRNDPNGEENDNVSEVNEEPNPITDNCEENTEGWLT